MLKVFLWERPKINYPTYEEFIKLKPNPTIKKDF